jgi:hypothetical protein
MESVEIRNSVTFGVKSTLYEPARRRPGATFWEATPAAQSRITPAVVKNERVMSTAFREREQRRRCVIDAARPREPQPSAAHPRPGRPDERVRRNATEPLDVPVGPSDLDRVDGRSRAEREVEPRVAVRQIAVAGAPFCPLHEIGCAHRDNGPDGAAVDGAAFEVLEHASEVQDTVIGQRPASV